MTFSKVHKITILLTIMAMVSALHVQAKGTSPAEQQDEEKQYQTESRQGSSDEDKVLESLTNAPQSAAGKRRCVQVCERWEQNCSGVSAGARGATSQRCRRYCASYAQDCYYEKE